MASTDVVTQASHHTKEGSTSGRFLSKLTRSPTSSRNHRASPSVNSQGSDTVSDQLPSIPPTAHSQRTQIRPELSRNTSAPVAPPLLNIPRENALPRTYSDVSGQTISQSNVRMLEVSAPSYRPPGSSSSKMSAPTGLNDGTTPQLPTILQGTNLLFQQFCDISKKRMATLSYLRKSHEGKMFWFNTVQFTKNDISRMPSYSPSKLGRRAMSFLLLGMSIPAVLEVHPQPHPSNSPATNSALALEFLKSLNILFMEFESYQQLHPIDGSHVSSLTRARLPAMFKRATTTGRPRRPSNTPADLSSSSQMSPPAFSESSPHGSHPSIDTSYSSQTFNSTGSTLVGASPASSVPPAGFSTSSSFPAPGPSDAPNSTLITNEGPYTHLLTPPLPFTPDFNTVFATLCDVLVDVYQKLTQIVSQPAICTPLVGESFSKTDARIRKIMVAGIVRDFEGVARENAKKELLGVQKVVLGGLMGA